MRNDEEVSMLVCNPNVSLNLSDRRNRSNNEEAASPLRVSVVAENSSSSSSGERGCPHPPTWISRTERRTAYFNLISYKHYEKAAAAELT